MSGIGLVMAGGMLAGGGRPSEEVRGVGQWCFVKSWGLVRRCCGVQWVVR